MPSAVNTHNQSIAGFGESSTLPGGVTEAGSVNFTGTLELQGIPLTTPDIAIGGVVRVAAIPFGAAELGGTETNTSFSFPANGALILDSWIYVADSQSGTMDVGTQGTSNIADGILSNISLSSTGFVFPTVTTTLGLNATFISGATVGSFWGTFIPGTDVAGSTGAFYNLRTFITGGDPVSITADGDLNSCSGTLFIKYVELPSLV